MCYSVFGVRRLGQRFHLFHVGLVVVCLHVCLVLLPSPWPWHRPWAPNLQSQSAHVEHCGPRICAHTCYIPFHNCGTTVCLGTRCACTRTHFFACVSILHSLCTFVVCAA
jgi:hypothetical protein